MTDQEINEAVGRKLGWCNIEHPKGEVCKLKYIPYFNHYATDIAAAWEVVEFVHQDERYSFHLYWHATEKVSCGIQEYLGMNPGRAETSWEVDADTAPMAICLAFLKLK
jgi:hypothetical protein